ncbi:hypothetical protein C0Q70_12932 [Pomacea canaliculata]|uniref:Uncharacterized protein n=1 Tax=Pomacea canaliculata TaxID=400727 RepID=A0A2T7P2X5_POMCA|nr:hypothetical protein C0Q70_12932 [Pomacea canaliculata]
MEKPLQEAKEKKRTSISRLDDDEDVVVLVLVAVVGEGWVEGRGGQWRADLGRCDVDIAVAATGGRGDGDDIYVSRHSLVILARLRGLAGSLLVLMFICVPLAPCQRSLPGLEKTFPWNKTPNEAQSGERERVECVGGMVRGKQESGESSRERETGERKRKDRPSIW